MQRWFALFLFVVPMVAGAQGASLQTGHSEVYAVFGVGQIATAPNDAGTNFDGTQTDTTPVVGLGITWHKYQFARSQLGIDLRAEFTPGGKTAHSSSTGSSVTALQLGFQWKFLPETRRLQPYLQISGGSFSAVVPDKSGITVQGVPNEQTSYLGYEFLGGVDYALSSRWGVRVAEVGFGKAEPNDLECGSCGRPNTSLFTANSGVVLHF